MTVHWLASRIACSFDFLYILPLLFNVPCNRFFKRVACRRLLQDIQLVTTAKESLRNNLSGHKPL